MPLRDQIMSLFSEVAQQQNKKLAPLSDEMALLDTGVDSLCLAVIVARLEDTLGVDPFNADEDIDLPQTVGDFIRLYEQAVA